MKVDSYCLNCFKSFRREGNLIEQIYVNDVICQSCRNKMGYYRKKIRIGNLKVTGLYPYQGLVRDMIIQYKEYNDEALAICFLYPYWKIFQKKYRGYILIPVPSSESAYRKRGFHHVEKMFSLLNLPILSCLKKEGEIEQKEQSYQKRSAIKEYLTISDEVNLSKKKILLIDDIMTSGSSLKACYKLVKREDNQVEALVISYNVRYLSKLDLFYQHVFE